MCWHSHQLLFNIRHKLLTASFILYIAGKLFVCRESLAKFGLSCSSASAFTQPIAKLQHTHPNLLLWWHSKFNYQISQSNLRTCTRCVAWQLPHGIQYDVLLGSCLLMNTLCIWSWPSTSAWSWADITQILFSYRDINYNIIIYNIQSSMT